MNANDLDVKVNEYLHSFDVYSLMDHLEKVGSGQQLEILDQSPAGCNRYYQWLACLVKYLKPKQIVELGPAAGISTIMMATQKPKDCVLYSVDIDKDLAWKWMKYDYPNVVKILGDDLDMSIWKENILDLSETDIWFIDTLHTTDQLTKELELYKPFFKKGAVVVLDDIRMPELWPVWDKLDYDKRETTIPNHHTGFGHLVI